MVSRPTSVLAIRPYLPAKYACVETPDHNPTRLVVAVTQLMSGRQLQRQHVNRV